MSSEKINKEFMSGKKVTFSNVDELVVTGKPMNDFGLIDHGRKEFGHQCEPNKRTNISFTLLPGTPSPELNFHQFDSTINLWSTNLKDEENVFLRQFQETESRANVISKNEQLLSNLRICTDEIRSAQVQLEINTEILNQHLCELEELLNSIKAPAEGRCFDLGKHYVYKCLMNIRTNIDYIEGKLSEVKGYLNDLEQGVKNVPCAVVSKIIRINESTIGKYMCDLHTLEALTVFVQGQMKQFEDMQKFMSNISNI